ncbi:MAG: hypothetical protein GXO83_08760 [Chlorobi bacterium]|nr:hypothetical protein [Chlorobiota bacterium]
MTESSTQGIPENIMKLQAFLQCDTKVYTYLHNTPGKELAEKILKEGLVFENHLSSTTDQVSQHDLVELNYFRMIRKSYGDITIVIQISSKLVEDFSRRLRRTKFHFSEALSKTRPVYNENDYPVYQLPEQFIKGYFDHHTNEARKNPKFDPFYFPLYFEDNLQRLLQQYG